MALDTEFLSALIDRGTSQQLPFPSCGTCAFSVKVGYLRCVRFPPAPGDTVVDERDYCGEWRFHPGRR